VSLSTSGYGIVGMIDAGLDELGKNIDFMIVVEFWTEMYRA